jgi:hypothetical protein
MPIIGRMKMESQAFSPVECSLRPVDLIPPDEPEDDDNIQ